MIDVRMLRENPDAVRASQGARGRDSAAVDAALAADERRRSMLAEFESLRAEQKRSGKDVAAAKGEEKQQLLAAVKDLAGKVKAAQAAADEAEADATAALRQIENVVQQGVPHGGEENSVVIRVVGDKPEFDFEPKDHLELGEALAGIDCPRGAKVSGSRFYFLTGQVALLERAMFNLAFDRAVGWGFQPMLPPSLVRPEIMDGTGFLGEHAGEVYKLADDELYLVGTSEVPLAGYFADEIVDVSAGPIRFVGQSACFRREAGSHGKDTRGIIRTHQFNKVEMFSFTTADQAEKEHEQFLAWEEQVLQDLQLPYHVLDVAAGDLGSSAARKFDCEAWVPTQGKYRELTSTSNCTTFQARRLGIRHRTDGGTENVATLNGTLMTDRWLVALLENHQQADGSVTVPEPLRQYIGGLEKLTPVT